MGRKSLTRGEALIMRAGRAHEDPVAMTSDALLGRLARHVIDIVRANPDLTDDQVARGARLRVKAEMTRRAELSAAARKTRAGLDRTSTDG